MKLLMFLAVLMAGVIIGKNGFSKDPNQYPTVGPTGLPKNCRAIIAANVNSWRAGSFTAEEAMGSIDRNCGASGY